MKTFKPKLVRIADKRGDELLTRAKQVITDDRAARDLLAFQPLDFEIPEEPDPPSSIGKILAVSFLVIAAFIAGLALGKWL